MLKGFIIILCCAASAFAQKLTGNFGARVINFQVTIDIAEEGSYELQQATTLGAWSTITNFNSLTGSMVHLEQFNGSKKFFRVKRHTVPASIVVEPQGVSKYVGQAFKLQTTVTGSWPLRLQWYKGATALPNETNTFLNFAGKSSESGNYALIVSNQWGLDVSATAPVQVTAPVATTVSGKLIHFDIQGGRAPMITSGNYDMNINPAGYYSTQSGNILLIDSGYWVYTRWDEITGYIQVPGSVTYPNGAYKLTFETPTTGTFLLTVPGNSGYQTGRFNFLN